MRADRLKTKYLNARSTGFAETQTSVDDAGIIVYQHGILGEKSRQFVEQMVLEPAIVATQQQLAAIALG